MRRRLAWCCLVVALAEVTMTNANANESARADSSKAHACPPEMAYVRGFCIDRWEISTVDSSTGEALSPYYPPQPKLLAWVRDAWLIERNQVGDENARSMPLP